MRYTPKPLISFVMPVYNCCSYIAESLESLIKQSVKNIEIVVVDDGSVDNIGKMREYFTKKDERINWITLEKNAGVGNARNVGNLSAKSDIIAVNDSDDMSSPERARKILDTFKDTDINVVHSGFVVINSLNEVIHKNPVIEFDVQRVIETSMCYICHSTMAYRKTIAEQVAYDIGEFSKLGMDDWKFQIDLHKKGYKFTSINKELVFYRSLSSGISADRNKDRCRELKKSYIEQIGGLI